ncbi:MAG: hypothetical protein IT435_14855 [Phycisphaerales bacterium]|nr:hypothetical protein [Phycisphaerales bacterium]
MIAILGIVVTLTIPILKASRDQARAALCLSNIRQSGVLLLTYSHQYTDYLPFAGRAPSDGPYPPDFPEHTTKLGGSWSLWNGAWSLLFPQEWHGKRWNSAFQCPRQRPHDPAATEYINGWFDLPMYWMTDVVGYDAATLRQDSKIADIRASPNRLSSVQFPSLKTYLWEEYAFCTPQSDEPDWLANQGTVHVPTSVLLFDGSADRRIRNAQIPGIENLMPYSHTVGGVYGRDLR